MSEIPIEGYHVLAISRTIRIGTVALTFVHFPANIGRKEAARREINAHFFT
jgi:hypothetical protein